VARQPAGPPAYDRVANDIRLRITTGDLNPGDQLPVESDLVDIYQVSRGTLREALRLLASEGLLETIRGRTGGTFVTQILPEDISRLLNDVLGLTVQGESLSISHLAEVRSLIEPPAAALAAGRAKYSSAGKLHDYLNPTTQAEQYEFNWQWHREVMRLTDNPLIVALFDPIFHQLRGRFDRSQEKKATWDHILQEHLEITQLIEAGDVVGVQIAMAKHLGYVHSTYLSLDKSGN
jgi:DNA-binding FadR family transcriptional regulator